MSFQDNADAFLIYENILIDNDDENKYRKYNSDKQRNYGAVILGMSPSTVTLSRSLPCKP